MKIDEFRRVPLDAMPVRPGPVKHRFAVPNCSFSRDMGFIARVFAVCRGPPGRERTKSLNHLA